MLCVSIHWTRHVKTVQRTQFSLFILLVSIPLIWMTDLLLSDDIHIHYYSLTIEIMLFFCFKWETTTQKHIVAFESFCQNIKIASQSSAREPNKTMCISHERMNRNLEIVVTSLTSVTFFSTFSTMAQWHHRTSVIILYHVQSLIIWYNFNKQIN